MVNCDLEITMDSDDKKRSWDLDVHIPLIAKDEYVLVPTVKKDMNGIKIGLGKAKISFQTYSNHEKVYDYDGRNSMFLYVNSTDKKTD